MSENSRQRSRPLGPAVPVGLEIPEEDAAEQRTTLRQEDQDDGFRPIPFDASEADVADQGRYVELDEDDYR